MQKPFPMDAAISAKLQRSLLRVYETTNAGVPPMLQQACTDIALALSDAISNYQIYKTYRGNSLKALEELSSFIAKKKMPMWLNTKLWSPAEINNNNNRPSWLIEVGPIHEEIIRLQANLGLLKPELDAVNAHIKVENT